MTFRFVPLPPSWFEEALTSSTPRPRLPIAAVPSELVPTRLPKASALLVFSRWMPAVPPFPEMVLKPMNEPPLELKIPAP